MEELTIESQSRLWLHSSPNLLMIFTANHSIVHTKKPPRLIAGGLAATALFHARLLWIPNLTLNEVKDCFMRTLSLYAISSFPTNQSIII